MRSQSTDEKYEVDRVRSSWTCICWDFVNDHNCCKHVYAVGFFLSIVDEDGPSVILKPVELDTCPYCRSDDTIRKGFRKNDSGNLQKYRCKSCDKNFSTNLGFENMHAAPETITVVMSLYFDGVSYRGVERHLKRQGIEVPHI